MVLGFSSTGSGSIVASEIVWLSLVAKNKTRQTVTAVSKNMTGIVDFLCLIFQIIAYSSAEPRFGL